MKLLSISKSNSKGKKYDAVFKLDSGKEKTIGFGATGYRDYTLMSDPKSKFYERDMKERNAVKSRYYARHVKREDWTNPLTAGTLSKYILWHKKTIPLAIKEFKKKFKV